MFRLNRNRSMQQEARRAPFFCLTATQQRGILSSRERRVACFARVWYNTAEGV